ncbi:MAG: membrane protein insertase YidC [Opitutaceae bacterium]
MDKKHFTLGSLFIIAAVACYYASYRMSPPQPNPAAVHALAPPLSEEPATNVEASAAGEMPASPGAEEPAEPEFASVEKENAGAKIVTLQNGYIAVHFTDYGGAIRDVALKKYPAALNSPEPFEFNELHKDPLFAFVAYPGLDRSTRFKLVLKTPNEVEYRTVLGGKLEVTRRYILSPDHGPKSDPYRIRTETVFRNLTGAAYALPGSRLFVALGTAAPVNTEDRGMELMSAYYRNGKYETIARSKLESSHGILGAGAHPALPEITVSGPMQWVAVANQFFVNILTPDQPLGSLVTRRVKLLNQLPDTDANAYGITADAQIGVAPLPAHGSETLGAHLYVGPKEYHRLADPDVFHANQDRVMDFGVFRLIAALLVTLMTWTHDWIPNWGVAIILMTLLLKICFMPFTLAASRSSRRMQKIQPELKALREKFKDNPQKQQSATMELFKKNRVNPAGGCLPMLVTIPFFWGFYAVLRNAAELRFAHFLWAQDLTLPDTVGHLFGFPINVLPILLGVTMLVQMRFTPQPTVDSSQQKIMKFMPLMFTAFYYDWSCALSLYSTVNAIFSIGQQVIVNRMKDPEPLPAAAAAGRHGKALKNVTPRRR